MLKPELTNDAMRFLRKRDGKQFLQIFQAITSLCDQARPNDSIAMGKGSYFRKDVSEYRVIYRFDESTLYVTVVTSKVTPMQP